MNIFLNALRRMLRSASRPSARRGARLCLEALEERCVPSLTQITPPPSFPATAIVAVVSIFPDGQTIDGTGAVVDNDHVLTAGHMIYDPEHGGWAEQIAVFGGTTSSTNYVASAYATVGRVEPAFYDTMNWNWATYHEFGEAGAGIGDIGLLTLSNAMGNVTGHLTLDYTDKYSWTGAGLDTMGYPEPLTDGFEMFYQHGSIIGAVNAGHYEGGAYNYYSIYPGPGGFFKFAYFDFSQSNIQEEPVQGAGSPFGAQSGSPLFAYSGPLSVPSIYGVMSAANSSTGYAEQITYLVYNDLQSWMDADNLGTTGVSPSELVDLGPGVLHAQTTLGASASGPVSYGQPVTFTAYVSIPDAPCPPTTGKVTFLDNGTALGTVQLHAASSTEDAASFTTSTLSVGTHSITAVYSGSSVYLGIVFPTSSSGPDTGTVVKAITTTDLIGPTGAVAAGQPATFTASVPGSISYPTGSVTFYDGNTVLGMAQLTQHENNLVPIAYTSFTTSALNAGSHTLTAVYSGDGNYQGSTSTAIMVQMTAGTTQSETTGLNLHIRASLIAKKFGKKKELLIQLTFSDGRPAEVIPSPFQAPAFKDIMVAVEDTNGDGSDDSILVTARKGKKTRAEILAV
jgi:V8-like Glu-specific endopeptidase